MLKQAGQVLLSKQLLKQQLVLFGQLAWAPATDVLRKLTVVAGTLQPDASEHVRRVGRPRNEWATKLYKIAQYVAPNWSNLVYDGPAWKRAVHTYCIG